MAVATDISQALSEIQPAAAAIQKSADEQKNKIQTLVNDMSKAINENNRPMIERHLQTLEKLKLPPYAQLLAATNNLLGQLRELEPEDGSDDLKKVNALTNSLGELQGKLERNFAKLKQLEDMANKALAQSAKDGSAAADEWAAMEADLNTQLKVAKTRLEAMHTLEDLADAAVKDGDQADLDAAIKKSAVRTTWKPNATEVLAKWSMFCKKCESKGLSKELQDQLTRDRARFQKIVIEIVDLNQAMDNSVKRIQAREIAAPKPIDFKALARALKIDKLPKADERLKAALKLKGSARANAISEIEKDAGVKFSSKDKETLMNAQ
jgi:flagellar biosynthesis chaperone FliJ